MKTPSILAAISVLLLASCASPIERRIERNPTIFNALSEKQKIMVQQGQVEEGMTKEAVFLSWGRPDRTTVGSKAGRSTERWSYTGYDPVQSVGFGFGFGFGYPMGYGRGRYGLGCYDYYPNFYPQTAVNYIPYEAAYTEFVSGKVSAWSVAH